MASFGVNAYCKDPLDTLRTYLWMKANKTYGTLEAWEITPTQQGMKYVIITRYPPSRSGRDPVVRLLRRVDIENPIVRFEDYPREE